MDDPTSPVKKAASEMGDTASTWLEWFLGTPLRVILIVLIGSILLGVVRRIIRRVTDHIAAGTPLTEAKSSKRYRTLPVRNTLLRPNPLARARRTQRARTIGSVLRSTANILADGAESRDPPLATTFQAKSAR